MVAFYLNCLLSYLYIYELQVHGLLKKSTKDIFSPHAELYVAEMISFRSFYVIFKMSFEMERWCAVWKNSWVAFSLLVFWVQCICLHNAKINQAIKAKPLQGLEGFFFFFYLLPKSTTLYVAEEEHFFAILEIIVIEKIGQGIIWMWVSV